MVYAMTFLVKAKNENEAIARYNENIKDLIKWYDSDEPYSVSIDIIIRADTKQAQDYINLLARNYEEIYIIGEPRGYGCPENSSFEIGRNQFKLQLNDKRLESSDYFLLEGMGET